MAVRMLRNAILSAFCACALSPAIDQASAKPQVHITSESERANDGVVSLISGTPGGTYFRLASDLSFVLDGQNGVRVLPIMGKGAGQNAYDLMYLRGVDLAFVRTDTIEQLKADPKIRNPTGQVVYIARLFNDELHVIVPNEITDIKQLAGRKVSFDVSGSGTDYSGKAMFQGLGVQVDAVNIDQPAALEALKRGELAAVVSVAAKPVTVVQGFDAGGRFHLLDIAYPSSIADRYYPADLETADYPKLVAAGERVRTLAVGTILAAVNHPRDSDRYVKLARFTDAFFSRFGDLMLPSRHPKWREVNLAATVPGWIRFQPAQDWLDRAAQQAAAKEAATKAAARADIQKFLESKVVTLDDNRDKLLADFLTWRAAQK